MELCLGTVQFGMDYGIAGQKQPSLGDAVTMLDYAVSNGIRTIDTASAYGTAEEVVGKFLCEKSVLRERLFLVSKLTPNVLDDVQEEEYYDVMKSKLTATLQRLHTDYLDSYLLHSSRYVFQEEIIEALSRLRREGYAKHIGVSVYEIDEAKQCISDPRLDFMQLPFSIFDQRMLKGGVFQMAEHAHMQIHSRSAFIQGLILMQEDKVPPFLERAKPILRKIDIICKKYGFSRIELAMGFVKRQNAVSHLVFGVDNLAQLKEDILFFSQTIPSNIVAEIGKEFENIATDIVMPSLWKK